MRTAEIARRTAETDVRLRLELDGTQEDIQLQRNVQNRLIFELARFRDAILERDRAFFQKMARQSVTTAAILEAARAGLQK